VEFLEHRRLHERPSQPTGDARCFFHRRCASRKQGATKDSIAQRITLRFHPDRIPLEDAGQRFGQHSLSAIHAAGNLFAPQAIERAFHETEIPSELNSKAKLALKFAWVQGYSEASLAALDAVVRNMNRHQTLPIA